MDAMGATTAGAFARASLLHCEARQGFAFAELSKCVDRWRELIQDVRYELAEGREKLFNRSGLSGVSNDKMQLALKVIFGDAA